MVLVVAFPVLVFMRLYSLNRAGLLFNGDNRLVYGTYITLHFVVCVLSLSTYFCCLLPFFVLVFSHGFELIDGRYFRRNLRPHQICVGVLRVGAAFDRGCSVVGPIACQQSGSEIHLSGSFHHFLLVVACAVV
jgi:hypothetical protein